MRRWLGTHRRKASTPFVRRTLSQQTCSILLAALTSADAAESVAGATGTFSAPSGFLGIVLEIGGRRPNTLQQALRIAQLHVGAVTVAEAQDAGVVEGPGGITGAGIPVNGGTVARCLGSLACEPVVEHCAGLLARQSAGLDDERETALVGSVQAARLRSGRRLRGRNVDNGK
jgi:hypothetical protein